MEICDFIKLLDTLHKKQSKASKNGLCIIFCTFMKESKGFMEIYLILRYWLLKEEIKDMIGNPNQLLLIDTRDTNEF